MATAQVSINPNKVSASLSTTALVTVAQARVDRVTSLL